MRKRMAGAVLLLALALLAGAALAGGFQSDLDGINEAAKSVLMLHVFDAQGNRIGTGSGFVAFDSYTLVTNAHVMENAGSITAVSDVGTQYQVTKVIAADRQKDIALLEFFAPTDLKPLALATGEGLRRAAPVVAIGSPEGVLNTVSLGNISALYQDQGVSYIQFTASISHGSSGGALFDGDGKVIGVTSGALKDGQNMNLAISIADVIAMQEAFGNGRRQTLSAFQKSGGLGGGPASTALNIAGPTVPPATRAPKATVPVDSFGAGQSRVFDFAGLMTAADIAGLESRAAGLRAGYAADFVILTFPGAGEDTEGFAQGFYQDNGFSEDGLLFFIDSGSGAIGMFASGKIADALAGDGLEALQDDAMPLLESGLYGQAAETVLNGASAALGGGRNAPAARPAAPFTPNYTFPPGFLAEATPAVTASTAPTASPTPTASPAPTMKPTVQPAATPAATLHPAPAGREEAFVRIGASGMWEKENGYWRVNPTVVNGSSRETVTGFTIAYFCGDASGQAIESRLTGGIFATFAVRKAVGPGGAVFAGDVVLAGYEGVSYIYAAVTGYTLASGRTVAYPREDWVFGAMRAVEEE